MKILIAGASGLVGKALMEALKARGDQPLALARSGEGVYSWDPAEGKIEAAAFDGVDVLINLSGENVASGRWTAQRKERMEQSRWSATETLSKAMALLPRPPKLFISASAIGYYGDRGDETVDEMSAKGEGFLSDLCEKWEAEARAPTRTRLVKLRIGVVLTPKGGALAKMVTPFKLGMGGPLGSGRQFMSWIALDELVNIICFMIDHEEAQGVFNAVAPNPVTNGQFTAALAKALRRPALLPLPAFAVRLLMGQMGEELLLSSCKALPKRLLTAGYRFKRETIEKVFSEL